MYNDLREFKATVFSTYALVTGNPPPPHNWKNPEYHVIAALRNLRTDTNCPAGKSWPNHDMIFWIFPIVPCHAFCMWHWPIGKNLDSSFIWGHHHLIVSIWISVYQLNTSYSLLRRTDETQQGRNSCLRLQMLASVWTLSCHCPVKLLTQYQPCIIVCYSVYFWLIRSFTDPAFTGSIFVCGPLHHHVLRPRL